MRTLVPAESLVYLESNDLAAALQPIVDSKPFTDVAKSKPDLSALKGVQVAVAVTGFETTEEKLTDEHSVGRIQPHFVAVADTHAWNYQAVGFAEKKLGAFVEKIYDSEPTLEKSDKNGGKYFTWKANDGRRAYALVVDSLIYFGNDETAIDKCIAVRRGEADSIAKAGKVVPAAPGTLASGYVGPDGIAQIANIIGLKFASEMGEDSEVQSAIAGILPQLLRKSVTDVTWTSTRTEKGIEDKYSITMPADVASVFNETMTPSEGVDIDLLAQFPTNVPSVTLYNLKEPQVAWRSVLLVAQKQVDPSSGRIIGEFSNLLFEPYGVRDPELFLSSIGKNPHGRNILVAKMGPETDEPVIIATRGDGNNTLKSLTPELKPETPIVEGGYNVWTTSDGDLQIAFDINAIKIGSKQNIAQCTGPWLQQLTDIRSDSIRRLASTKAPITTVAVDRDTTSEVADLLSERKSEDTKAESHSYTETRFTKTGIDRRTTSDFGLIGSIIAQLGED